MNLFEIFSTNKTTRKLPVDCLDDVLEFLGNNKATLHSCLLVNRLWCETSVKILWRNIWDLCKSRWDVPFQVDESKDFLHENGIFITAPTSKPPLFNYVSFFKVVSIYVFVDMIQSGLKIFLPSKESLVLQEVVKMFMNQISCLKRLDCRRSIVNLTRSLGTMDCF